jgi:hypothetical protein
LCGFEEKKLAYDDIYCFIQVYHYAFLIDYGNRRDGTFRKHMNKIEYGGFRAGSGDWIIRVLTFMGRRRDICADPEFSQR